MNYDDVDLKGYQRCEFVDGIVDGELDIKDFDIDIFDDDELATLFINSMISKEIFYKNVDMDYIDADYWLEILENHPDMENEVDWQKLKEEASHGYWINLILKQKQFEQHCPFENFNVEDWALLLENDPSYAAQCDWSKFDTTDLEMLLTVRPELTKQTPLKDAVAVIIENSSPVEYFEMIFTQEPFLSFREKFQKYFAENFNYHEYTSYSLCTKIYTEKFILFNVLTQQRAENFIANYPALPFENLTFKITNVENVCGNLNDIVSAKMRLRFSKRA